MRADERREGIAGLAVIELVIGAIVVAFLIVAAVPICSKYSRKARLVETRARIEEIVTAAKAYARENRDAAGNPTWPSSVCRVVDLRPREPFSYSITSGGGGDANTTPFTIVARGIDGKSMASSTVMVTVANIGSRGVESLVTGF